MIKLRKTLRNAIASALLAGSALFPFRGDFTPRHNFNIPRYEQKLVAAHRGGTEQYRENSLEAFSHLKKTGADMAEMDVRSTKDGKLIVYHDRTIAGRPLKWITYNRAEELANERGYHIAHFDEALKTLKNKKVIIDLHETGTEKKILETIGKYLPNDNVIISSRDADSLRKIKSINKNVKTSVVMPSGFPNLGTEIRERLGIVPWRQIKQANAEYVSVDGNDVNQSFYNHAGDGVGILVYGLKNKGDIKDALAKKNVVGIISDKPSEVTKIRNRKEVYKTENAIGTVDKPGNLESLLIKSLIILLAALSIIFLSPNLTGNTINNFSINTSNFIGIGFFILLLLILFFRKNK